MTLRVFVLLCLTALSCCVETRLFDLTVASNQQVALDRVDLRALPRQRVEGREDAWEILFPPLLGFSLGQATLEGAVDDALERGQGDLMINVVVYRTWWSAVLFGRSGFRVEGDAIPTAREASTR